MCDEICKYERFRERKWNKIRKRGGNIETLGDRQSDGQQN